MRKDVVENLACISFGALKVGRSPGAAVRCSLFFLLLFPGARVQAGVTMLIEAPINFLGHVSSTGHAALLIQREFPRHCRGGSSSLTFAGVHPRNSER